MSPEKSVKRTAVRRASGRDGGAAPEPATAQGPEPERRYVDVDPWAMLLEQLMEMPEERPAEDERKPAEATRRPTGPASGSAHLGYREAGWRGPEGMASVPRGGFERRRPEANLLISRVADPGFGAAGWNSSPNSVPALASL